MINVFRMLLGIPPSSSLKTKEFEIQPNMVTPDVVRMDMKSFRNSEVVRNQAKAARESI